MLRDSGNMECVATLLFHSILRIYFREKVWVTDDAIPTIETFLDCKALLMYCLRIFVQGIEDATGTLILILDFGSQYTQLIARRIREIGVYCEILPWDCEVKELKSLKPAGIVLSGSHHSVLEPNSPRLPPEVFEFEIPLLGICYGMQLMAIQSGGCVKNCGIREFGFADVKLQDLENPLWNGLDETGLPQHLHVWMSHGDEVETVPPNFEILGHTDTCPIAAMGDSKKRLYAVQFHLEVTETQGGTRILKNWLKDVCDIQHFSWKAPGIVKQLLSETKHKINALSRDGDVLLALSGGVDSSVVAMLLHQAIGSRLRCVLVDNGLLRTDEASLVQASFKLHHPNFDLTVIDAADEFLSRLEGVTDPEEKRKIIGNTFIQVFERTVIRFTNVKMLAQGTIYPDVIESAGVGGGGCIIKTHHNVGGLPSRMELKLIEPIRRLFKDEVRQVGEELGLPHEFVWRHPFPGPGLGVRVLGSVDSHKCNKLRHADSIWLEELRAAGLYDLVSQAFAVLLPCYSVGVKGDARFFDQVIAIRAVQTVDFMTAQAAKLPWEVLQHVARRICNEVDGVSRVVYDLTGKPPATIEWE